MDVFRGQANMFNIVKNWQDGGKTIRDLQKEAERQGSKCICVGVWADAALVKPEHEVT